MYQVKEYIKSVTSPDQRRLLKLCIRYLRNLSIYLRFFIFWSQHPRKKFIIFAQGRSGSTLLVDLLNSHPEIHCDDEILNVDSHHIFWFIKLYIKARSMVTKLNNKSVYGFHVKIYQLTDDHLIEDPERFLKQLCSNGWVIIYLKRNNVLRHALSNVLAIKRNLYHISKEDDEKKLRKVNVNFETVLNLAGKRKDLLKEEQKVLADIPHLAIEYEKDLLREKAHQRTADKIFEFLGLSSVPVYTSFLRTSKNNLSEIIENYSELKDFIGQSEFAEYLD